jgi:hypothetical protein
MVYYLNDPLQVKVKTGGAKRMKDEQETQIDLSQWYSAAAAADRLSRNSGKKVVVSYPRKLAQYGLIRSIRISERNRLYWKEDVDRYIVEERGEKAARTQRQNAKPKKGKRAA